MKEAKKSITKEELRRLPLMEFTGDIVLIRDLKNLEKSIEILSSEKILGFDTETRPAFRKGEAYLPSLVQLAAKDQVHIIQLSAFKEVDLVFEHIFANKNIIKAGLAIRDDIAGLNKIKRFQHQSFLELVELSNQLGLENRGLRGLSGLVLGGRVSKNEQTSNWANPELTLAQLKYAATDAWVCRELYFKLNKNHERN